MNHDEYADELPLLLTGELDRSRLRALVLHLRGCPECRAELVETAAAHAALTATRRTLALPLGVAGGGKCCGACGFVGPAAPPPASPRRPAPPGRARGGGRGAGRRGRPRGLGRDRSLARRLVGPVDGRGAPGPVRRRTRGVRHCCRAGRGRPGADVGSQRAHRHDDHHVGPAPGGRRALLLRVAARPGDQQDAAVGGRRGRLPPRPSRWRATWSTGTAPSTSACRPTTATRPTRRSRSCAPPTPDPATHREGQGVDRGSGICICWCITV